MVKFEPKPERGVDRKDQKNKYLNEDSRSWDSKYKSSGVGSCQGHAKNSRRCVAGALEIE